MASSQPDSLNSPAAASSSQSKTSLTIDDITRLFSFPISEAASVLGVSTGVLKRLCRKNGIAKWPYRQLLSGKSLEDIQREAAIERSKDQKDPEKMNKRQTGPSKSSPISTGPSKTIADQDHRIIFGQGNKFGSPNFGDLSPIKHIPTYMDEFKYGFPSTGLSSCSYKWWGTEESSQEESETLNKASEEESETLNKEESSQEESETLNKASEDESETLNKASEEESETLKEASEDESETLNNGSDVLCSLRRKAVEEMEDLIKGEDKIGFEEYKLNKRQKMVLSKVFGSSLPDQWTNICS